MAIDLGFGLHPKWVEAGGMAAIGRSAFLGPLREAGLTVLEFTLHSEGEEWPPMRGLAAECVRAGYRCHFHAPYQGPFNPERFAGARRAELEALYAEPIALAEQLAAEGSFTPSLVIHGATSAAPLPELAADTRAFLEWVLKRTRISRLMLELLPPKPGLRRLGETHEQVTEMVRDIGHPRLGICWDLGHEVLQGYSGLPPAEFVTGVRHVHIHDIGPTGEDHFPLIFGRVPWESYLRGLMAAGFDGAVVLEINGYRASAIANLYDRLVDSFAAMKRVVQAE